MQITILSIIFCRINRKDFSTHIEHILFIYKWLQQAICEFSFFLIHLFWMGLLFLLGCLNYVSRFNEGSEMIIRNSPEWSDDPLSTFFKDAEYNVRVTAFKFPKIFDLLGRVHALFKKCQETTGITIREQFLVPCLLMVRSHSCFLAGTRLATSGQISEAFCVLRSAVESAWYALHIAKDPKGTERAKIWLKRNEDDAAKSRCKSEFTIANVRKTHEDLDASTARELYRVYEDLIDFGAHPNQFGTMIAMVKSQTNLERVFSVGILYLEEPTIVFALRKAVEVGILSLKTLQLTFPERFELSAMDLDIEKLTAEANAVFKSYGPKRKNADTTG